MIFFGFRRLSKWSLLLYAARFILREGRRRWGRLQPDEQRELRRMVTTSKGRQSRLTPEEQAEMRRLVAKAQGRDPIAAAGG